MNEGEGQVRAAAMYIILYTSTMELMDIFSGGLGLAVENTVVYMAVCGPTGGRLIRYPRIGQR